MLKPILKAVFPGLFLLLLLPRPVVSDEHQPRLVSFPTEDGGQIYADLYGKGYHGVVLAHGGRFNKGSWSKQAQVLAQSGFRVLAIDFRGYGKSTGSGQADPLSSPLYLDVLAAVRYLRKTGSKTISVIGGSMGASAAADASMKSQAGEIDRLVLLAGVGSGPAEKLQGCKLFVVAREDTLGNGVVRLIKIREQYEKASEPKKLIVLEGSAHSQFLFQTDQGDRLMHEIVEFLSSPKCVAH